MGKWEIVLNNGNSIFMEANDVKQDVFGGIMLLNSSGDVVARFWNIQGIICPKSADKETADKQITAPVGTVKSVRIIEPDGRERLVPLDKVIIERYVDGQI